MALICRHSVKSYEKQEAEIVSKSIQWARNIFKVWKGLQLIYG